MSLGEPEFVGYDFVYCIDNHVVPKWKWWLCRLLLFCWYKVDNKTSSTGILRRKSNYNSSNRHLSGQTYTG